MKKTNALRILDSHKIDYSVHTYEYDEGHLSGNFVTKQSDLPTDEIYKTIVAVTNEKEHIVLVIPITEELDLKKSARVVEVKRIELIRVKDLLPLTGYMRGGCSPVGMKKVFRTFIDDTNHNSDYICISAGKRGMQVRLKASELVDVVAAKVGNLTRE